MIPRFRFASFFAAIVACSLVMCMPAFAQAVSTDLITALGSTPLSTLVPYVTSAIAVATALLLLLPAPGAGGWRVYAVSYNVVHLVANLRQAPQISQMQRAETPSHGISAGGLLLGLMLAGGMLSACTDAQMAQAQQIISVGCMVDGMVQPAAVALAPAAGATAASLASTDAALVHPAVVAACAALKGIPVTVNPPPITALAK
jgi:hypothetical protein